MIKTTILLPEEFHQAARKMAYETENSLGYLFREAMSAYLRKHGYLPLENEETATHGKDTTTARRRDGV